MDSLPIWLLVAAYAAHIMEEFYLDWRCWAQSISKITLSWAEFFVANAAVIILGFCCAFVGFSCPMFSYMFVGLALVNAAFAHIATTIIKRKFSPGLLTSLFLFIPIGTWAYIEAAQRNILTIQLLLITLSGGIVIMVYPIFMQRLKMKVCGK